MRKCDIKYKDTSVVCVDILPFKLSYTSGSETRIIALLQLVDGAVNFRVNLDTLLLLLAFLSYRGINLHQQVLDKLLHQKKIISSMQTVRVEKVEKQ